VPGAKQFIDYIVISFPNDSLSTKTQKGKNESSKNQNSGVGAGTHASQHQVPKHQSRRVDPKSKKKKMNARVPKAREKQKNTSKF
jgi:hypothetical protein